MAVMKRGSNVALTREVPGLAHLVVGVWWDAGAERVLEDNLVVATLLCDASSKVLSGDHVIFFNQLASPDLSVRELEAALGGDQEQVEIDLADVPAAVDRVVVVAYLNEGTALHRSLGQLRGLRVRVLQAPGNQELVRSEDLAPALADETALVLGEVYRLGADWKFRVVGEGYRTGIAGIAADYGVPL